MLNNRSRRGGERGQVLIMALAFLVFFGLVTTAVLQLADTVELQQSHTEAAATSTADIEGGMLFAAQAAQELGTCYPTTGGSLGMTSGVSASYTTNACNPGSTADLIADECSVCILSNDQPADIDGTLAAQGPIAFNGGASVTAPNTVTSTIDGDSAAHPGGFIGCVAPSTGCPDDAYSPAVQGIDAVPDPLASATIPAVPPPSPNDYPEEGPCANVDDSWNPKKPIPPGIYCSIAVDSGAYTLAGGIYTILNTLAISGSASLTSDPAGPGVLVYFTCHYDGTDDVGSCSVPVGDADGGMLDFSTSGNVSLMAYQAGTAANPDNVLIYFDPAENEVADYDQSPDTCQDGAAIFCISGSGSTTLDGSVYTALGKADILGGETQIGMTSAPSEEGDLVVSMLTTTSDLTVDGIPPAIGYCWIYDDSVSVSVTSGTSTSTSSGQVDVASDCTTQGTGIMSIAYGS